MRSPGSPRVGMVDDWASWMRSVRVTEREGGRRNPSQEVWGLFADQSFLLNYLAEHEKGFYHVVFCATLEE